MREGSFASKTCTLKSLITSDHPFLTVKKIVEISEECQVDYSKIVGFLNTCRNHHSEIRNCLLNIAKEFRPDIYDEVTSFLEESKIV